MFYTNEKFLDIKNLFFFLFLSVVFLSPNISNASLPIPLEVRESLINGVSGVARNNSIVTVGIPLADSDTITSVSQLGLSGVGAGQFRALAWWPSGNIKWALADFQSNLTAGGTDSSVILTSGTGNFGGSDLATDGTIAITISTGTAIFTIKKANSNVIDSISVGGDVLVTSGHTGGISVVGSDDTIYTSNNDSASTATIEENGPVRSVVKVLGCLKDSSGNRLMDYTLRMHFYKGKSQVKAILSLRNASKDYNYSIAFKSAEVVIPITLSGIKHVTLALEGSAATRTLTGTANLQQGYNSDQSVYAATDYYNWAPPVPGTISDTKYIYDTTYQGFLARVDTEIINSFGILSDSSDGYARLYDENNYGVSAAFKDMNGYWPESFEIKATGEFSVELYGKWTGKTNKLPWGKHTTREWMWDFHTTENDPQNLLYEVQYPLIATAPFANYRDSKVWFGQDSLPTEAEEAAFFTELGETIPDKSLSAVDRFFRVWPWSMGGGDNQIDFALADFYDFLRTGNVNLWKRGQQRTEFMSDAAVIHSDDWTTTTYTEDTASDPMPSNKGLNGKFIDMEHALIMNLPMYYYLTGNEFVKDSFTDYCEVMYRTQTPEGWWFNIPDTLYFRAFSRKLRNLALAHEFTRSINDTSVDYMTWVIYALNYVLDSREDPALGAVKEGRGRNLMRGYLYWDTTHGSGIRVVHNLFHSEMWFEALFQVRRVILDTSYSYSRMGDLESFMTGLSEFYLGEDLFKYSDYPAVANPYGLVYGFELDTDLDSTPSPTYLVPYDASRAALWAYEHTGNATYLTKGEQLLWAVNEYSTPRNSSDLQGQALIWTLKSKISPPSNLVTE